MTIQSLFDEYVSVSKDYQVSGIRQQQIIQEVEALVRKETCLSLLDRLSVLDVRHPLPKHLTALDIHVWAKEQGIIL